MTPTEKRTAFRTLHAPGDPLVMPNPWDIGSAKLLAGLGAKALATTSAGHAFTIGKPDMGRVTAEEAFAHAAAIVSATDLPVNADFENGYGAAPEAAAATVRRAAEIGLAGCSIEDADLPGTGAYDFPLMVERAEACVEAARESGIVLTLRADGYLTGAYDAAEAVRRCAALAETGADVIYAPFVPVETLRELCAIGTPVNVLAAGPFAKLSRDEYAEIGVARISIGGALSRVTHRVILDLGAAILGAGDFSGLAKAASGKEVDPYLI